MKLRELVVDASAPVTNIPKCVKDGPEPEHLIAIVVCLIKPAIYKDVTTNIGLVSEYLLGRSYP